MAFVIPLLSRLWGRARPTMQARRSQLVAQAAMNRVAKMRARYDAAQTTSENSEHWRQADELSGRAANSWSTRRTLRTRARYEVGSNCYASGMLLTVANDVVGTGPRLQMALQETENNQVIEREFMAWARSINLPSKLRTAVLTKKRDGEIFIKMITNPGHGSPVWLDLELLEGDQCWTPAFVPDKAHVDGIAFDQWGNPESYDLLDCHPGDDFPLNNWTPKKVAAADVCHWFRTDRPGARRGIPEITPALPLYAQLRRFTLAVITAAETAADHAGILESTASSSGDTDGDLSAASPFDEVPYSRGMLTAVPFGWKLSQLRAEHPTTTYAMFKAEILNEIARCLNMPFNVAAGNSQGYNYSSGRLDHQIYFRSIGIEQADCETVILDKVFRAWYREARLIRRADGSPLVPEVDLSYRPFSWAWDPAEDLDPVKTANANMIKLSSGQTSIQRMFSQQGLDWEVEQQQQAESLGITLVEFRKLLVQKFFGALAEKDPRLDKLEARRRKQKRAGLWPKWLGV
jgi:capsid protein